MHLLLTIKKGRVSNFEKMLNRHEKVLIQHFFAKFLYHSKTVAFDAYILTQSNDWVCHGSDAFHWYIPNLKIGKDEVPKCKIQPVERLQDIRTD